MEHPFTMSPKCVVITLITIDIDVKGISLFYTNRLIQYP